ncbi:hypothetical protein C8R47DRAFT_1135977 [Mycena vitilis]|nr:hypothetical protein C8R47DRAFT_1135977 [Mycena vitilis]
MNMGDIADPGYASDTGERDVPTCAHFEANRPVEKLIDVPHAKKVLNRKGRAVCRIVASYGWSDKEIGRIFGVSYMTVFRAVHNTYTHRDRIEDDYKWASPDFLEKYPPLSQDGPLPAPEIIRLDESDDEELDSSGRPQREAKTKCRSRIKKVADGENEVLESPVTPQKRSHEDYTAPVTTNAAGTLQTGSPAKRSRYGDSASSGGHSQGSTPSSSSQRSYTFPGSANVRIIPPPLPARLPPRLPLPLPKVPLPPNQTTRSELEVFLKTWTSVDFVPHCELLIAQGFTLARLHTLATWSKAEIEQAVHRLLTGKRGVTAMASVRFEFAVQKLTSTPPARAPRLRSILPRPSSDATNGGATLHMFLQNVMGLDLSGHHALLEEQGFDIATLSAMAAWEPAQLQDALARTLLAPATDDARTVSKLPPGKPGLKALEVLALEFCIKRAASE